MKLLAHEKLVQVLQRLGVSQDASEYHGALCGMLSHGDYQADSLIFDEMKQDDEALAQLKNFTKDVLAELEMPEFMPSLPDDDQLLSVRVEALATWCAGFLYGLGTSKKLDIRNLTEESQELIRDFTEISRAGMPEPDEADIEESDEEDELAYTELVEYVRVGAQLIFLEIHPHADPEPQQDQATLH